MAIRGIVTTSFVDYPGQICTTVFFGGCNFRCPWCHNKPLIKEHRDLPRIEFAEVYSLLEKRRNWVQALCITGGEPTLNPHLVDFVSEVKRLGCKVKLDTNGSRPKVLARLLQAGLVDYVAMDIKSPPTKYQLATGVPVEIMALKDSIGLLTDGPCQYEFRTTVVPGLLTEGDLLAIGEWLAGADCYVLQRFVPRENVLAASYRKLPAGDPQFLQQMAPRLGKYFARVLVRG